MENFKLLPERATFLKSSAYAQISEIKKLRNYILNSNAYLTQHSIHLSNKTTTQATTIQSIATQAGLVIFDPNEKC